MSSFESPYSYLTGILHLELAEMLVQKLTGMFSNENLQKNLDPFVILEKAQESLKICEIVFKNEEASSQDFPMKLKINDLKLTLSNFC